jgi:hypothetical protein
MCAEASSSDEQLWRFSARQHRGRLASKRKPWEDSDRRLGQYTALNTRQRFAAKSAVHPPPEVSCPACYLLKESFRKTIPEIFAGCVLQIGKIPVFLDCGV